jgi:hypothetical protein
VKVVDLGKEWLASAHLKNVFNMDGVWRGFEESLMLAALPPPAPIPRPDPLIALAPASSSMTATTTHTASSWSHDIDVDLNGLLDIDELLQYLLHVHRIP